MYDHSKPLVDDRDRPGPLGKLFKFFVGLVALVALALVGLSLFIRFYLTTPRLKALLIPPMEKALGRAVTMGDIDAGLFSGISVQGLSVKEADKKTDFVSMDRFALRYRLLPLLRGKLEIAELTIDQPFFRLHRDLAGHFNFESLAPLAVKPAPPATASRAGIRPPLALDIDRLTVNQARLTLDDARQELPTVTATGSARLAVTIPGALANLRCRGDFDFIADLRHGELTPQLNGKGAFADRGATCTVTIGIDQQQITLAATANDLTATPPLSPLRLDISSDTLDLDRLLALADKLPKAAKESTDEKTPPGLDLAGTVKIHALHSHGLVANDLALAYTLKAGVASVHDLALRMADGQVTGTAIVDFTKAAPPFQGKLAVKSLQLQTLLATLVSPAANILSGAIDSKLSFAGAGLAPPEFMKHLALDADFTMQPARLTETPLSAALAGVLHLDALRAPTLDQVAGNLHIKEGRLLIDSQLAGQGLAAKTAGTVDVDSGALNLPLELEFSGPLAAQLRKKASVLKYLTDRDGTIRVALTLTGSTAQPRATLNRATAQHQLQQKVEEKVIETVGRKLPGAVAPAQQLLKDIQEQ